MNFPVRFIMLNKWFILAVYKGCQQLGFFILHFKHPQHVFDVTHIFALYTKNFCRKTNRNPKLIFDVFLGGVVRMLEKRFFEEKYADARQKAQQD